MNDHAQRQHAARLEDLFHGSPIGQTYGMRVHFNDDLQAVFDLPYNPAFDHALGGIHGGVVATMIDNAGWFTAAIQYNVWVTTVEFHVRLLEALKGADLRATGRLLRRGKRLAVCDMTVHTSTGVLVASGSGTFAVTGVPLESHALTGLGTTP